METSRAVMWRERARTTRNAKANAAWRNGYYQGFQEEIAHRYEILRREMESDDTGRELVAVRSDQVDAWIEANVTFAAEHPKLARTARASRAAYRHGREDGSGDRPDGNRRDKPTDPADKTEPVKGNNTCIGIATSTEIIHVASDHSTSRSTRT